ncbi:sel1 repeat family protein, partial [bacterium]|nr:sel1 repeat family protein [bacterium]
VPKDDTKAVKWYRKAAEEGFATAQFNLAYIYYQGEVVPQDYAEALKWNRRAAEQGVVEAQANLGLMYESGEGVAQDYPKAYMFYNLAAIDEQFKGFRERIKSLMTKEQIAEGQNLTREWLDRKAKEKGK